MKQGIKKIYVVIFGFSFIFFNNFVFAAAHSYNNTHVLDSTAQYKSGAFFAIPFTVPQGGTGVTTMSTAYAPVIAGVTPTSPLQVASTGLATAGYVLTSNGLGAAPSFQSTGGSGVGIVTLTGNSGAGATGLSVAVKGGNNISTTASGSTVLINVAGTTDHAVQVGNATNSLTSIGVATNGQVLLGSTGADPAFVTPTTTGTGLDLTANATTLNYSLAVPVSVPNGGTGATTLTNHGVLLGQATSPIVATAVGATNTVLLGNTGADPSFGAVPNSALTNSSITLSNGTNITVTGSPVSLGGTATIAVSGIIPVTSGGTGVSTMTTAYAPVCAGTSATGALQVASTGLSTAGFVLTSNGAAALPSFQDVSASGAIKTITGDSGGALSGSNITFTGGTTGLTFAGAGTTETLTGTLVVSNGGTGRASLTAYAVLCGGTTTTSAVQSIASVGTSGQILTSNGAGALPTFQTAPASTIVTTYNVGSGNHTLNANTKTVTVIGYGGGGGGGSGRRGATTAAGGGSGGGSGSGFVYSAPVSFFGGGGSVIAYVVGAGGTGGTAVSADNTNGNNGTAGGYTSFGNLETSVATSNAGQGGTTTTSTAGASNVMLGNLLSLTSTTPGGAGSNVAGSAPIALSTGVSAPTGGGGGGGGDTGTARAGGAGGAITSPGTAATLLAGGTAGAADGGTGGNGNTGASATNCFYGGTGGGGGGGRRTAATGGTGGVGGVPGGGGGGGGGGINAAANSGAGGNGGAGILYVIEFL